MHMESDAVESITASTEIVFFCNICNISSRSMELFDNLGVEVNRRKYILGTFAISFRMPQILFVCSLNTLFLFALISPREASAALIATTRLPRTLFQPNLQTQQERRDYSNRGNHQALELFEVSKPPDIPKGATEVCAQTLMHHVFGNTIKEPPVVRPYSPSPNCGRNWSRVVLRWKASCTGRQFDRISAVWLGGVEIFRTCTAEPVKQPGIEWTVEKDVTRFSALWEVPQLLALELANVVEGVYTGFYDVTLSVHFYMGGERQEADFELESSSGGYGGGGGEAAADVILPFPRSVDSHEYWFRIHDESDVQTRKIRIPRNAYKAVIEICVSFHELDEFWYINPPNEYNKANNLTDTGNGAFRDILVTIDGLLAGVVYPFPVIYTGGVNPYFWRPISGIGSFVLPSYDVDMTPFLGKLLNGEDDHKFSVSVTNALPSWLLGLNLHIWVDDNSMTRGEMISHFGSRSSWKTNSEFLFLDGTFLIKTSRLLSHSGWLVSSFGNLTTSVEYSFRFSHALVYSDGGNAISVHQESVSEKKVVVKSDENCLVYDYGLYRFPLRLSMHQKMCGDENYVIKASVDHAWEEERQYQSGVGYGGSSFSTLKNRQQSRGKLLLPPTSEIRGVATTKQSLVYDGTGGCYFRSLGVTNDGSFLFDHSDTRCT